MREGIIIIVHLYIYFPQNKPFVISNSKNVLCVIGLIISSIVHQERALLLSNKHTLVKPVA